MSTLIVESSRFDTLEIDADAIIEFPTGLIGLDGYRWTFVGTDPAGPFQWLHSLDDPSLALPVADPWLFFPDYEVELADADSERVGAPDPSRIAVWVTVRTGPRLSSFSANLRAPILVWSGRGHQVINETSHAPVRAPLFPEAARAPAAA